MSHTELLADLTERLRADGFHIAPDDYLRAVHVAAHAEDLPAARLRTLLCPLFADSRQQQERFGDLFEQVIKPPALQLAGAGSGASEPQHRKGRAVTVFLLTIALFGAAVVFWQLSRVPPPPTPAPPSLPKAQPGIKWVLQRIIDEVAARELRPLFIVLAAVAAILGGLATLLIIRAWRRRYDVARSPDAGPPYDWRLQTAGMPVLFSAEDFGRLSRALRGKTESESTRLDLERTIAGATRNPADAQLAYSANLKTPEYVVLIEKRSERDHHAAYFDRLVTLLAADGVDLRRYYFDYDPRVCWSISRRARTTLADLHRRSPDARLIVFGMPRALFDPISGAVDRRVLKHLRWQMQAIVTAGKPVAAIPSTHCAGGADGLASLGEFFSGGYRKQASPAAPSIEVRSARQARQFLSPAAWRWLLACAAYPRLQWELTVALGFAISPAAVPSALRELIAIPWFREGEIPDGERTALTDEIRNDLALERTTRLVILDVLSRTPVPAGSYAAREKALQVITQDVWLHRDERHELRSRLSELREFRIAEIGRDSSLLRFLLTAPGSPVASRLPHSVRRLWYHSGIPSMGRREVHGLPVAACVAVVLFAANLNFANDDWRTRASATKPKKQVEHFTYEAIPADTSITSSISDTTSTEMMSTDTSVRGNKVRVDARSPWNASGWNVRRGDVYAIDVAPNQFWRDASTRCGPTGYENPNLDNWKRMLRRRDQQWFALIGAVGKDESTAFPVLNGLAAWTAPADGELFFYANDIWFMYWNNHDSIEVVVRRIRTQTGTTDTTDASATARPTGATGSTGSRGSRAPSGTAGASGATGIIGRTGASGVTGISVAAGPTGATGSMGPPGELTRPTVIVYFNVDEMGLNPEAQAILAEVANRLIANRRMLARIIGASERSMNMAIIRSGVVRDYLVKLGVDTSQLITSTQDFKSPLTDQPSLVRERGVLITLENSPPAKN